MPADPMQELIEAVESVPPYARLDLTGSKKAAFVALTLGEWEQVKAALLSRAEQAKGGEITEAMVPDIVERGRHGEALTAAEAAAWTGYELGWRDGYAEPRPLPPQEEAQLAP